MTDRASVPAEGWIVTVLPRRPRQRPSTAEMWISMHSDAQEAITAVRIRRGSHTTTAMIEVHQKVEPSLATALSLAAGQVKRFG